MGASGHGRVIADLAKQIGCYEKICFLDDDIQLQGKDSLVVGDSNYAVEHKDEYDVIIAVGNSGIRKQLQEKYERAELSLVTLIHPDAVLPDENLAIGKGTVVMAGAVIQPGTEIGKGVIVNTASSIDHECKIGDYSHIAVGSHLAGNVEIGTCTWIGAGTAVSNNISICNQVMVGAGATVIHDITKSGTYVGVPVEKIK